MKRKNLLNAILTPTPTTILNGYTTQNVLSQPILNKKFAKGQKANRKGQKKAQARRIPTVPMRLWRGGKMIIIQKAWEKPVRAMKREMRRGVKPRPPREMGVNQNTGRTDV